MKLTTKGRYAVLALTDLAMEGDNGYVKISDIAVRQNISSTYLEQILLKLKREGLSFEGGGKLQTLTIIGLSFPSKFDCPLNELIQAPPLLLERV